MSETLKNVASFSGSACGTADPAETPASACGSACGTADPNETPASACGSACEIVNEECYVPHELVGVMAQNGKQKGGNVV